MSKRIKVKYQNVPVLMLSAVGQSSDRIRGLKAGADDYMPKPFNLEELLLKVHKSELSKYETESCSIIIFNFATTLKLLVLPLLRTFLVLRSTHQSKKVSVPSKLFSPIILGSQRSQF